MKKIHIVRELAIIKNHLYQIITDPKFYGVEEPARSKLMYVYKKVSALYDMLTGVENGG
jgi:hypothetical protein